MNLEEGASIQIYPDSLEFSFNSGTLEFPYLDKVFKKTGNSENENANGKKGKKKNTGLAQRIILR